MTSLEWELTVGHPQMVVLNSTTCHILYITVYAVYKYMQLPDTTHGDHQLPKIILKKASG